MTQNHKVLVPALLAIAVLSGCKRHVQPKAPVFDGAVAPAPQTETPPLPAPTPAGATVVKEVAGYRVRPLDSVSLTGLPKSHQPLAAHLCRAAEASDRILYAQHHRYNLAIKDLLETLLLVPDVLGPPLRINVVEYLSHFWLYHGHHDLSSGKKFVARFTMAQLSAAAQQALARGVNLGTANAAVLRRHLALLKDPLFNARYEPKLQADFYRNVRLKEAQAFEGKFAHNAQLARVMGKITEHPFRAGGQGVPEGLYVNELHHVIKHLNRALAVAQGPLKKSIAAQISYLTDGEARHLRSLEKHWFKDQVPVQAYFGFLVTDRDPLGQRGLFYAAVGVPHKGRTAQLKKLSQQARALFKLLPGRPAAKNKTVRRGIAFSTLYAAAAAGPVGYGAAVSLPGSRRFLMSDMYRAKLDALLGSLPDAQCADALPASWIGLRQIVAPMLIDERRSGLPGEWHEFDQLRADLVALWLATHPKALELDLFPTTRCSESLLPAYVEYCVHNPKDPCRALLGTMIDDKLLKADGTLTHPPSVRKAVDRLLRFLTMKKGVREIAKRLSAKAEAFLAPAKGGANLAYLSPVVVTAFDKRGATRVVQQHFEPDWLRYQLARARAWRLENSLPLMRPAEVVPARPGRSAPSVPLNRVYQKKVQPKR